MAAVSVKTDERCDPSMEAKWNFGARVYEEPSAHPAVVDVNAWTIISGEKQGGFRHLR